MKNIKQIIEKLNECNISVYEYKEGKKLCGYELNTYTDAGVNQIVFIDFRDTEKNPKSAKDFIELFNDRVNDIDIDDEVIVHMQQEAYRAAFSLTIATQDFKDWKEKLQGIFPDASKKPAQQRQFEQVKDKLESLISEIESTLDLMPVKGNSSSECQRTNIVIHLSKLYSCVNGIELSDFTPNDYSGDFKLSYS